MSAILNYVGHLEVLMLPTTTPCCFQMLWNKEEVNQLQWDSGKSLADLVALEVGNIGENLAIRRAAYFSACDGKSVGMYVHPAGTLCFYVFSYLMNCCLADVDVLSKVNAIEI